MGGLVAHIIVVLAALAKAGWLKRKHAELPALAETNVQKLQEAFVQLLTHELLGPVLPPFGQMRNADASLGSQGGFCVGEKEKRC